MDHEDADRPAEVRVLQGALWTRRSGTAISQHSRVRMVNSSCKDLGLPEGEELRIRIDKLEGPMQSVRSIGRATRGDQGQILA